MEKHTIIGLMSGTSVDSVDAAAFEIASKDRRTPEIRLIGGISFPISSDIKQLIFDLFEDRQGSLYKLCQANIRIGHLFADAVEALLKKLSIPSEKVDLIGSHGQTVYHIGEASDCCGMNLKGSLQIGEASVIAQRTGIPVVSDFRVADIAAGGSGAPLVPFFDKILAENYGPRTAFQNIGGIGNLSYFESPDTEPVAFDTGPGNMIVDRLVHSFTNGVQAYDIDGNIGKEGNIIGEVLRKWMLHPYLTAPIPKTTGREDFGTDFIKNWTADYEITKDLIRTAEEYTALTIVDAYKKFLKSPPLRLIVCGGGAFNPIIMNGLKRGLPETQVLTGDEAGISSEFKEAAAFALMAWCFTEDLPNNVESATGAERPVIMGKLSKP